MPTSSDTEINDLLDRLRSARGRARGVYAPTLKGAGAVDVSATITSGGPLNGEHRNPPHPDGCPVRRPGMAGIGLTALALLMVACGGREGPTAGATQSGNAPVSECADARLSANMSADEYRVARIEYRRAEPAYTATPDQLAEAEFALHRPFIEVTPPGAQAQYAYVVCADLAALGILGSAELKTAALGFGYNDCAIELYRPGETSIGNEKKVDDAYRRIYINARTILCPQVEQTTVSGTSAAK